ncbi:hypothetical protein C8R44DRAFT_894480 [Mycena epipterygia]|nr:hypothetical protein C8R44DRAFT_894480 [Mycena epipterygia]
MPNFFSPRFISLSLLLLALFSVFTYYTLASLAPSGVQLQHVAEPYIFALDHPTFADVRRYERALPQHHVPLLTKPTCSRYVYFSWETWGIGWNNVLEEQLLNTHLAYLSRRGYVFADYVTGAHPPFPDKLPNGVRHMLHIPMNALTSGPTGGGELGPNADPVAPRAVSLEWWDGVCPPEDVVEVELKQRAEHHGGKHQAGKARKVGGEVAEVGR